MRNAFLPLVGLIFMVVHPLASAQEVNGCGNLQNHFGPFDYRDPAARGDPLRLVETGHFTKRVETLQGGQSTDYIIQDLDYALRAFPNHHRVLNTLSRYALTGGKLWTNADVQGADCYFQRAIAWAPDDAVVRLIYGNYLEKRRQNDGAKEQYEEALRLEPTSLDINYNAGLFFLGQGDLARAKSLANVAYAGGYPLQGLKNKIEAAESRPAAPKNNKSKAEPANR